MKIELLVVLVFASTATEAAHSEEKERRDPVTLRLCLPRDISGFDPARCADIYSNTAQTQIYESLLQYAYPERPYRLVPCLAEAMPEVSDEGKTYAFRIRKGVRFQDDPCFPGGKGRELEAEDFIYAIKRTADAKVRSVGWWMLDGSVRGLNEFHKASASRGPTDYDEPVEGLKAVDRHTLRITLTRPNPSILHALATVHASAIAREAVEHYGPAFARHPVGTGAYRLASWVKGSVIVFNNNHAFGLPPAGDRVPPFCDRVEVKIIESSEAQWSAFLKGDLDVTRVAKEWISEVDLEKRTVSPRLAELGVSLKVKPSLDVTFIAFNMDDPLLGGNKFLRQAMSLAYDAERQIRELRSGRAIPASGPLPPGLPGAVKAGSNPYRIADRRRALEKARALMEKAGYPGGQGLPVLTYQSIASATSRAFDRHFLECMKAIGVRIEVEENAWPDFLDKVKKRKAQVFGMAWVADYPDPENFLQLFYSSNGSPGSNASNYANPRYDRLYGRMAVLADSPERNELIREMVAILQEDCPWIFGVHRLNLALHHDWLSNYRIQEVGGGFFKYYRIDPARREKYRGKGERK
jgi:ABC-type transport system substrate-binding protein